MIPVKVEEEKLIKSFRDTNYFAKGTYKRDFIELFSTATLANFITKTVLAPLQRWKIIKQTQITYELRPKKMNSFFNYSEVKKDQGLKAFWRGNSANLWLHGWQVLFQMVLFDTIKSISHEFSMDMQSEPISKFLLERIVGPFIASFCTLAITHPIDTARVRISMNYYQNSRELFTGITSCWSYIRLQQRSIKPIYRGFLLANLMAVLHLNIFHTFRSLWSQIKKGQNELENLLLSKQMIGSLASILLLHPLDTIKKNLQLNNQSKPVLFRRSFDVFLYIKEVRSASGFYQGLSVTILRHLLYCPIFTFALENLNKNVKIF